MVSEDLVAEWTVGSSLVEKLFENKLVFLLNKVQTCRVVHKNFFLLEQKVAVFAEKNVMFADFMFTKIFVKKLDGLVLNDLYFPIDGDLFVEVFTVDGFLDATQVDVIENNLQLDQAVELLGLEGLQNSRQNRPRLNRIHLFNFMPQMFFLESL